MGDLARDGLQRDVTLAGGAHAAGELHAWAALERQRDDRKNCRVARAGVTRERSGDVHTEPTGLLVVTILPREQPHAPHDQGAHRHETTDGTERDRPREVHATKIQQAACRRIYRGW